MNIIPVGREIAPRIHGGPGEDVIHHGGIR